MTSRSRGKCAGRGPRTGLRRVKLLTVLSAWKLRRTQPDLKRSFTIPGGGTGLLYVVAAPILMALVALVGGDKFATIGGAIALAVGPVVYGIIALASR